MTDLKHKTSCDLAPYLLGLMPTRCTCGVLDHAPGSKPASEAVADETPRDEVEFWLARICADAHRLADRVHSLEREAVTMPSEDELFGHDLSEFGWIVACERAAVRHGRTKPAGYRSTSEETNQ